MAKAVRVGDTGTAHDGFPPTPVTSGSPDVFIDGIPAARVGDPLESHSKPKHPPHARKISSGSSTVMINNKPAAITGGSVNCGGVTMGGGTVNIGDEVPQPQLMKKLHDRVFIMKDETGQPLRDVEYRIVVDGEIIAQGKTDHSGQLPVTDTGTQPKKVQIFIKEI
ncbi:type VI secretion system PAAR protein [Vibrio rhizosphaerae]|uniref:Type VI secretion system PAAR protein n=1 Tax=Vibrio rhizosphaerae TaxID=398736 RepID=A0ABU4IY28_9VIBR|nr:type VI secretion system PAAR protein [Vibrio rhizosphaerae]MDW6094306.1 type VI secretion system PAAR protein [Vibrio rhizosphaerae]